MNFRFKDYTFLYIAFLVMLAALALPSKIALVAVSGIAAVYAWLRPKNALLLLILYVPIRPLFVEVNSGLKLAGDVITFVTFARVLWDTRSNWKSWFSFQWFEWGFFAFLAFGTIIGLTKGVGITAIVFQLRTFLIMYLLYYIISRMKITKEDYYRFAWVTVQTALLISVHGIIEKISLRTFLLPETWVYKTLSMTNAVRIYGLPGNPNSLAIYLGFAIMLVLMLMKMSKGKQLLFLRISLVLFFGIMLLTFSRGTWLAIALGFAVYILLTRQFRMLKSLVLAGVLGYVFVLLPVNLGVQLAQHIGIDGGSGGAGGISNRFKETFDEKNLGLMAESGRLFYIKKGFEVFGDHPVTGTGLATFGDSATLSYGSPIYEKYGIRSDIYGGKYFYSDNQYIQVLAETGIIGALLFAVFLIGMLVLFWKHRKEGAFPNIMIAMWLSTCAMGMYYNIWELKIFTLYYFLILGAYMTYIREKRQS